MALAQLDTIVLKVLLLRYPVQLEHTPIQIKLTVALLAYLVQVECIAHWLDLANLMVSASQDTTVLQDNRRENQQSITAKPANIAQQVVAFLLMCPLVTIRT